MSGPPIGAVVFDFDGLILDTEIPVFESWSRVYAEHGHPLELAHWRTNIGTDAFDPAGELEALLGRTLDRQAIDVARRAHRDELQAREAIRPGVVSWLDACARLGLATGVASSSSSTWVVGHLERLGVVERFDCIRCRDHVDVVKPDPAVYRAVVDALDVAPEGALAVEDSVPGVAAARAAGMWCVAVPGSLTQDMDYGAADVVLGSLADRSLDAVIDGLRPRGPGDGAQEP